MENGIFSGERGGNGDVGCSSGRVSLGWMVEPLFPGSKVPSSGVDTDGVVLLPDVVAAVVW